MGRTHRPHDVLMNFIDIDPQILAEEYRSGMSLRKLAIKYNTSKLTIKRKLEKHGVKVLSSEERIKKFAPQHIKESARRHALCPDDVLALYKQGLSIGEISSKLSTSQFIISNILKKHSLAPKQTNFRDRFFKFYKPPIWNTAENLNVLYVQEKKSAEEIAQHYHVDPETIRKALIDNHICRRTPAEATFISNKKRNFKSNLEIIVESILDDFELKHNKTFIDGVEFDLVIDALPKKLLVEINGTYSHLGCFKSTDSQKKELWEHKLKDQYDFITIWEHEFTANTSVFNILNKSILLKSEPIQLKELHFKDIDQQAAHHFYSKYHYLGKTRIGRHIGAFYHNVLVACATFSWCTRIQSAQRLGLKNHEVRELTRFCIHPRYKNRNFGSFCMSRMIKIIGTNKAIKKLITFADTFANHNGALYKAANWAPDGETKESYYYEKNGQAWHKRTIWGHARSAKLTEEAYAALFGMKKIRTSKKFRFTYEL